MNVLSNVIKVLVNTLMTLILVVGLAFVIAYLVGFEPFVVETGSMQRGIPANSVSFINKRAKYESIKKDDIIAFVDASGNRVMHRVVRVTDKGFETKGDANNATDGITTTRQNFVGKCVFAIPNLGYVVKYIQTTNGRIVLISAIVVVLALGFIPSFFKKKKKEPENESKEVVEENN